LLNDVAAAGKPFVLVLDDYHTITARSVHDALTFMLDHLPPQMLLVIATRMDPPLVLSRLRGGGQLVELRAADLCFTRSEVSALFENAGLSNLKEETVVSLESRTEGWITALHLAAQQMVTLSQQRQSAVDSLVATLSGTHRHIADYLTDQVLDQRSPEMQGFLLETSILERLSGPLCDAVTGRSSSQSLLESLEADNLFLVPLDDERRWYRYHHLFADLLRVRLEQRNPDRIGALYRRASEWFASVGDVDAAISSALAACDRERALDLLDQHAEALWRRGEYATLLKWLDELGDEAIRPRNRLRVHHALASIMAGELSAGAARLRKLERDLGIGIERSASNLGSEPVSPELSFLTGMVYAGHTYLAYYQRNVPHMISFAQQALEHLSGSSRLWQSGLAVVLGTAYEHSGRVGAASEAFSGALASARAMDSRFLSLTSSAHLAISYVHQGQLERAVRICREQLSSGRLSGLPATGTLHAVWGDVLREWNRLDDARLHMEEGCRLCEQGRGVAMIGWSTLALARLLFSEQDFAGVHRVLLRVESLAEPPTWVFAHRLALEARVHLAQGRLEMAERLLLGRGLTVSDEPSFLHLPEHVALARLWIAQSMSYQSESLLVNVVDLLDRLRRASESGGWTWYLIQVLTLLALAYQVQGRPEKGQHALNQALTLAEPNRFMRIFLDEGEPVIDMLRRSAARRDVSGYLRQLFTAVEGDPVPSLPPLDPLSEREMDVLRLLAKGLSNKEIADRLFITPGTVKVHASNIYGKLGVSGRAQAAAWGRELGLL
jgi:LuxR family maltose regulon positive regulatory protein